MSLLYRIMGSSGMTGTDADRRQARSRAMSAASPGDWLSVVLRHHQQIEAAFHAVTASADQNDRRVALGELTRLLTGHCNAEESVLYPALARCGESRDAEHAYQEQAHSKMHLASLERLVTMSQDFVEELELLRQAVVQHHFEEEAHRFIELVRQTGAEEQRRLGQRLQQEFDRYVCSDELISVLESIEQSRPAHPAHARSSCEDYS